MRSQLDSLDFALQSIQVMSILRCIMLFATVLLPWAAGGAIPELAEYRGHVVWLDFWASWCGPCQQSFPWMQRIQQRYADKGLLVVTVNLDHNRSAADRFLSGFPHDFTVRFDAAGGLPMKMNVKTMPTSFLLDAAGNVVATHAGFKTIDEDRYEAELAQLLMRRLPDDRP